MQRDLAPSSNIFSSSLFSASSSALSTSSRPSTRDGTTLPPPPDQPPPIPPIPPTSSSSSSAAAATADQPPPPSSSSGSIFSKDRRPSFARRTSSGGRRRSSSANTAASGSSDAVVTSAAAPPALPEYALAAAAKVTSRADREGASSAATTRGAGAASDQAAAADTVRSPVSPEGPARILSRSTTGASTATMSAGYGLSHGMGPPPAPGTIPALGGFQHGEANMIHQQITDVANKRISTLDYLRKAHEGRVYWFNTYLYDRPDLARMPYFDHRKLARKATNYLLLGLSLPTISDLYSSTPLEFLRSLNTLLSEFDSFQQLHGDSSASSLSRARFPNMFRRPGKPRRSTTSGSDPSASDDPGSLFSAGGAGAGPPLAPMNFAASESDLLPGEEYTHLLTPSLPFDPDFFETFATLCDTLIDCYTRFLALVPSSRECTVPVAELFAKADGRVRKLIVQGVVKELEEQSRAQVKTEVAGIGKVVLSGLM